MMQAKPLIPRLGDNKSSTTTKSTPAISTNSSNATNNLKESNSFKM